MRASAKVTVDVSRLKRLNGEIDPRASAILRKFAFDVEAGAKDRAPVLTGFLRNSIQAIQKSALTWWVVVGAEYGAAQEFGTRFMRAHPYLIPALEDLKRDFLAAWKELFE